MSQSPNEFSLVHEQVKELFKAFPELEFKTIAAFALVIGWLLTAENAQTLIRNNSDLAIPSVTLLFFSMK